MFGTLGRVVPACSKCVHFVPHGVSKNYDLGMCTLFRFNGNHYFAEMARLEPTKCGVEGYWFKDKNENTKPDSEKVRKESKHIGLD